MKRVFMCQYNIAQLNKSNLNFLFHFGHPGLHIEIEGELRPINSDMIKKLNLIALNELDLMPFDFLNCSKWKYFPN